MFKIYDYQRVHDVTLAVVLGNLMVNGIYVIRDILLSLIF